MMILAFIITIVGLAGSVCWTIRIRVPLIAHPKFVGAASWFSFAFLFFAVVTYGAVVISGASTTVLGQNFVTVDWRGGYSFAMACMAFIATFLAAFFTTVPFCFRGLRNSGDSELYN